MKISFNTLDKAMSYARDHRAVASDESLVVQNPSDQEARASAIDREIKSTIALCGMDVAEAQKRLDELFASVRKSVHCNATLRHFNVLYRALQDTPALTGLAKRLEKHANALLGVHEGTSKSGGFIEDRNPQHQLIYLSDKTGIFEWCKEDPAQALQILRRIKDLPSLLTFKTGKAPKEKTEEQKSKEALSRGKAARKATEEAFKANAEALNAEELERMLRTAINAYAKIPYDMRTPYGQKILETHFAYRDKSFEDLEHCDEPVKVALVESSPIAL